MTDTAPGARSHTRAAPVGLVAGLVVVAVVGALLATGAWVVRTVVLDPDTYNAALVENDVGERLYTEVLADPELAEISDALLGELRVPPFLATQARALTTAALRWTVPPSTLRAGSDAVITGMLAYVRGDTDTVDVGVDTTGIVERVDANAVRQVRTLLAEVPTVAASSIEEYRAAVRVAADDVVAGRLPTTIPEIGPDTDPDEVVAAIVAVRPDLDERSQQLITAAVVAGQSSEALIATVSTLVGDHARAAADRLDTGESELDVVDALAERGERRRATVVAVLDPVRDAARWFGPPTFGLGLVLFGGALAGVAWTSRDDPRRALTLAGLTALGAGAAVLVGSWIVDAVVTSPLAPATSTGPDSWNLPTGMRSVLGDVESTIAADILGSARASIALLLVLGGGLVLTAAVRGGWRLRVPRAAVVGVGIVALGLGVWSGVTSAGAGAARACNGHPELCDRAYDEVAYAGTHNAMSSPDVVAVWPEHDGDLRDQLDAGVHALLIDTHEWTELVSEEQLAALDPLLTPELTARLWADVEGLREARSGTYLCHIHCAFGSIELVEALTQVSEFLDANPDEVVTLIVQDDITPAATEAAVLEAGLGPYLYTPDGDGWPTLGAMIDAGERLVVFAEASGPPPDWYLPAFEAMQETPFLFLTPEELSCEPSRGDPDATLFLMNHWVQRIAPDRVDSALINERQFIVDRARQCERERGLAPNFIAVNFYNIGDTTGAVDELNGVADG